MRTSIEILAEGGDDEVLLVSMYDHMGTFKQLLDTTTQNDMTLLCLQYSGFYRYAKLLERVAQGIADGSISVLD